MLKPVLQAVQLFIKGATGKDRQDKNNLSGHLLKIQVAYDQLQQQYDELEQDNNRLQQRTAELSRRLKRSKADLDELVNVADGDAQLLTAENQDLQQRLRTSEAEKVRLSDANNELMCELAVIKQQLELRNYKEEDEEIRSEPTLPPFQSDSHPIATLSGTANAQHLDSIDLTGLSVALIGGHETTYREVKAELKRQHGLKRCVHIPPHSIASHSRNQIKEKIDKCDLSVVITSYVDHSVSKCVKRLNDTKMLAGDCIRVSCHGKSGIIREVLQYFGNGFQSSEAV
ncbi:MAG: DUF2325 domain-containing protein [Cyanobacteria bacterium J06627_28]